MEIMYPLIMVGTMKLRVAELKAAVHLRNEHQVPSLVVSTTQSNS
jgi:hypothetical protein